MSINRRSRSSRVGNAMFRKSLCTSLRCWTLQLGSSFALAGFVLLAGNSTHAQITPDGTLGDESSIVTPNARINQQIVDLIEGGAVRGANLFHSFQYFNVSEGQQVYFTNPTGIETIFSRVTGTDISDILGTLGVNGNANLFLLNPNGIVFGPHASLDIRGAFVASTAESLVWENGTQFSATNPQAPPLLTINVTPGLQYGSTSPQSTIINRGNLAVGQDFTMQAGTLNLQGQLLAGGDLSLFATDTVKVRDTVTSPFIAAARRQLLVQGNQNVDIFALNHPDSGLFAQGDLVLRSENTVGGDAHYSTGGSFRIEQLDGSLGRWSSPDDPIIRARGDVSFDVYVGASLHILAGGKVDIGTVIITGTDQTNYLQDKITLSDGTDIQIDGREKPTLDVRAGVDPDKIGMPGITGFGVFLDPNLFFDPNQPSLSDVATSADITIGDIVFEFGVVDGVVLLTNQYQPNPALPGGQIEITGKGFFGFGINTNSDGTNSPEKAGDIIIDSRGGIVSAGELQASSDGDGGEITLIAQDTITTGNIWSVSFSANSGQIRFISHNGAIDTTAGTIASFSNDGTGGDISFMAQEGITTGDIQSFSVSSHSGQINLTSTNGRIDTTAGELDSASTGGTGGDITFVAHDHIQTGNINSSSRFSNSGEISLTSTNGRIDSTTGWLDSSSIEGNGGNIWLSANGTINTADILAPSFSSNSGQIRLTSNSDAIDTSAGFIASASTDGKGGDVTFIAQENITTGTIQSFSRFSNSGEISITSNNGRIDTTAGELDSASTEGNGGDILLSANGTINTADILASSFSSNSGQIRLTSNSGAIDTSAGFIVSASTDGKGGDVTFIAQENITTGTIRSFSRFSNSGEISLTSNNGGIDTTAGLLDSASTRGNAGNILLSANGNIYTADISSVSEFFHGGEINFTSNNGKIDTTAGLLNSYSIEGNGGDITLMALEQITTGEVEASSVFRNSGRISIISTQGGIDTTGGSLSTFSHLGSTSSIHLEAQNEITTGNIETFGSFSAGDIILKTRASISTANSLISSTTTGSGKGGNIYVQARSLSLTDGATISSSTLGTGDAGSVFVITDDRIDLNNSVIIARSHSTATGKGGNITIETDSLSLTNVAGVSARALGQGDSGNITITAQGEISLSNFGAIEGSVDSGKGGNITITADSLSLDNSSIGTDTVVRGEAGNISIFADGTVSLANTSTISSSLFPEAVGKGGEITIAADSLSLMNTASIFVNTWGQGDAGNIVIDTNDAVYVENFAGISSNVLPEAVGNGGEIRLKTGSLSLRDSASIDTSTNGQGNAGDIIVQVDDQIQLINNALINSSVNDNAVGQGGEINLASDSLYIADNSGILSGTIGQGNGGRIVVNVDDSVSIMQNAAIVTSSLQGDAGDIEITTPTIFLNDGGIVTEAFSGEGGNIRLQNLDLLLMRHESQVSATAGRANAGGNGGNITIDATDGFIIGPAYEDNDITANAYEGNGGNINITAQRIIGLRERPNLTPKSDITASSEFGLQGTIETTELAVDPNSGLVALPTQPAPPEVAQNCQPGEVNANRFYNTGSGGLPPNPNEALVSNAVAVPDWVTLDQGDSVSSTPATHVSQNRIIEAQGWVKRADGTVVLTAEPTTMTLLPTCTIRSQSSEAETSRSSREWR
ncbi:two-partner secretion domain-containing protein [Coleofasciculus sp. F4-SAH-05]|uniref:two-partner secretion domain-containing protein n=1 Tax=Coleofasciculus sp. F4-SAH-05 TaxID=3069525 RepID=UPI0032F1869A